MNMHCCLIVISLSLAIVQGHSGIGDYGYIVDQPDYVNEEEQESSCSPPVEDGLIVTPFKRSYDQGETIELSCEDGYKLNANRPISTCRLFGFLRPEGRFSPDVTASTCEEMPGCKAPLGHGLVLTPRKAKYDLGENITISCMDGYELTGEDTHTCTRHKLFHGTYVAEIALSRHPDISYTRDNFGFHASEVCIEISDCDILVQEGLHVKPFKRTYKPGEEITLSCEEEYQLVISNISICQKSGSFALLNELDTQYTNYDDYGYHYPTKACKKKRKCMPLEFDGLIITPLKDYYLEGEEVTVSCEEGYLLTNPERSVCGAPDPDADDEHSFFDFLDRVSPFAQFGPRIRPRTCSARPRCYTSRSPEVIIFPETTMIYEGETIEVSCTEGYALIGGMTRTCMRDDDLFERYGYSTGHFSPDLVESCSEKITCKYPSEHGVILTPRKSLYDVGDSVSVSCRQGYVLKKANTSNCLNKESRFFWSDREAEFSPKIDDEVCEKIPSCDRPMYEGIILTPDLDFYEIGDKITVSCEEGYEQRVAPSVTCMRVFWSTDGRFDPNFDSEPCRKAATCMKPVDPNLIIQPFKVIYSEGETINLSCKPGYSLEATEEMTCERALHCSGQFGEASGCFHPTPPMVFCKQKPTCYMPDSQPGMILTPQKDVYYVGDELEILCAKGYTLTEPSTVVCKQVRSMRAIRTGFKKTVFKPDIPKKVCEKKRMCDAPQPRKGMSFTPQKDIYYTGDVIQISCEDGYRHIGPNMVECVLRNTRSGSLFSKKKTIAEFKPAMSWAACEELEEESPSEESPPEEETLLSGSGDNYKKMEQ